MKHDGRAALNRKLAAIPTATDKPPEPKKQTPEPTPPAKTAPKRPKKR